MFACLAVQLFSSFKMRNVIIAVFSVLLASLNASLLMKDLPKKTFEVDEIITIEWINNACQPNDLITIDLINDRPEVMIEAFVIISDIFVKQKKYEWKIPRFIKSSGDYHLRVYLKESKPGPDLISKNFSIINPNPTRQSTLNLLEPTGSADGTNLESTCLIGEQCYVLWDYPGWAETAMPKLVDINLYSGDKLFMVLARELPVGSKSFLWRVPESSVLKLDNLYVVVAASGRSLRSLKPGESYYLASAGYPFKLETRGEREERRLNNSKPIDFTAPGPIKLSEESKGEEFIDVPRPTYGGGSGDSSKTVDATSTSAARICESNRLVSLSATVSVFIFFIFAF